MKKGKLYMKKLFYEDYQNRWEYKCKVWCLSACAWKKLFLPVVSVVIAFKNELKWLKSHIEGGHNLPFQSTRISFEVVSFHLDHLANLI